MRSPRHLGVLIALSFASNCPADDPKPAQLQNDANGDTTAQLSAKPPVGPSNTQASGLAGPGQHPVSNSTNAGEPSNKNTDLEANGAGSGNGASPPGNPASLGVGLSQLADSRSNIGDLAAEDLKGDSQVASNPHTNKVNLPPNGVLVAVFVAPPPDSLDASGNSAITAKSLSSDPIDLSQKSAEGIIPRANSATQLANDIKAAFQGLLSGPAPDRPLTEEEAKKLQPIIQEQENEPVISTQNLVDAFGGSSGPSGPDVSQAPMADGANSEAALAQQAANRTLQNAASKNYVMAYHGPTPARPSQSNFSTRPAPNSEQNGIPTYDAAGNVTGYFSVLPSGGIKTVSQPPARTDNSLNNDLNRTVNGAPTVIRNSGGTGVDGYQPQSTKGVVTTPQTVAARKS